MVNLYDSPAQAQFINTYVPIQFDNLYKVADKAQKDMDAGNAMLDKLNESRSLGSLSNTDNATWDREIAGKIQSTVDDNVKSNYDLSNPTVLSKLSSLTRSISSSSLAKTLINSKESLKQAAGKVDAQWGDTYSDKFRNYDSQTQGEFTGAPMAYEGWEKASDPITKDISSRYVGTKDGYRVMKIDPNDVISTVNAKTSEIASNPQLNMLIDQDIHDKKVDMSKYTTIDPVTNQPVVDPDWRVKYAKDRVVAAKMDATKGATYQYDQAAADARRLAEDKLYHAQTLSLKQQVIAKNNIVENYLTDKIIGANVNKGNDFLTVTSGRLATITDPNERFKRASQMFGPTTASYLTASMKKDQNSKDLQLLQNQKANAQANSLPINDINTKIDLLNRDIQSNNVEIERSRPGFNSTVQNEEQLAKSGKSNVWTKEHLRNLNTVETPYKIANAYAEANYGKKIQVAPTAGGLLEGFTGPVSRLQLRDSHGSADRNDVLLEMQKRIAGSNKMYSNTESSTLDGFIKKVTKGEYENKGFAVPDGSSVIDGNKANAKTTYYVPEEALTPSEIGILKKMYGHQEIVTKDNTYDEKTATTTSVKKMYIPIPSYMSSVDLDNHTSNVIANSTLAKEANIKFNKENASATASESSSVAVPQQQEEEPSKLD